MADLEMQVVTSARQLQAVWQVASTKPSGTALPPKCYEHWQLIASLHASLARTIPLFEARRFAWQVMQSLASNDRELREAQRCSQQLPMKATAVPNFTYDGVPMDFPLARHFATTGYVCSTWSLYDRLANVCGRLATWKDIPDDPWQDPKLWGNLMGEGNKTLGGFMIQQSLANAYGWPTGVAYKIRNWLVHDGGDVGRGGFFRGSQITDGFLLHPDAIKYLENCCGYMCEKGRINRCCLSAAEEPWSTQDLVLILKKYHGEVDAMLTSLVRWSVDSLAGQVSTFSDRDRQLLVTAAATASPSSP